MCFSLTINTAALVMTLHAQSEGALGLEIRDITRVGAPLGHSQRSRR
jgi:hypothetical protein